MPTQKACAISISLRQQPNQLAHALRGLTQTTGFTTTSGYRLFGQLAYERLFGDESGLLWPASPGAAHSPIGEVTDRDFAREVEQASHAGAGRVLAAWVRVHCLALLRQLEQLHEELGQR